MKALVLTAASVFEFRDEPVPAPAADEVLIAVKAVGICGSDVHGMGGSTGRRIPPIIMGHEAAGSVAACGAAAGRFKVGDRVAMDSTIWCGSCGPCRGGRVNLCENRKVLGVSCPEYRRHGAMAEYVAVPERIVFPLPEGMAFEKAALIEALSVAVHAVSRAKIRVGDTVTVIGCGMIGILCQQVARLSGAGRLIAADVDPGKLRLAQEQGADQVVNTKDPDAMARLAREKAHRVIEAVGIAATVKTAVESVRPGGTVVLVGNLAAEVAFPLQIAVTRELEIFGTCASAGEIPVCIDLIASGRVRVEPFLSAVAPLSEGPAWFKRLESGKENLFKVVLDPSR